jgi:hypothetical protein
MIITCYPHSKSLNCPKQHDGLIRHVTQRVRPFWGLANLQFIPRIILVAKDVIACLIICFSMCGVWLGVSDIQCTYTSFTTIAHHGFGHWWSLNFISPLNLIMQHNQYILMMIEHFLKWLNLVPLLYCNSKGTTYAFWTMCLVGLAF